MTPDEIRESLDVLTYNLLRPTVTTMGPCANGCGAYARGSGECATCLIDKIGEAIGDRAIVAAYALACQREREWYPEQGVNERYHARSLVLAKVTKC